MIRLFRVIEDVCQVTLATVLTVVHRSHEDTSTALWSGAFPPQSFDLAITINLVVLEHSQLGLLSLMLDLLGCGVDCVVTLFSCCSPAWRFSMLQLTLLLPLLTTTTETKDQMKSRFLLDVVVRQGTAVFELLSGEDQTLLIRWNTLLVYSTWMISNV